MALILTNSVYYCKRCNLIKEDKENAKHCAICDVCIEGFDHHCPWVGKCVGKNNFIFFQYFVVSTLVLLLYLVIAASLTAPQS